MLSEQEWRAVMLTEEEWYDRRVKAGNEPGDYCSFRSRRTCLVAPVVETVVVKRNRRGKVVDVTFHLCEVHQKTIKRETGDASYEGIEG